MTTESGAAEERLRRMLLSQEVWRRSQQEHHAVQMERRPATEQRTPFEKRRRRREVVAAGAPKPNKDRLWVIDRDGGERHLVDTGAEVSILMASALDRQHGRRGAPLTAANGSSISTYGERTMAIHGSSRHLTWTFTVADVEFNILGTDFLAHHNLLIDLRQRRLVDTLECIRAERLDTAVDGMIGAHCVSDTTTSCFSKLLADYPSTTKPEAFNTAPTHDVEHFIDVPGPPIRSQV